MQLYQDIHVKQGGSWIDFNKVLPSDYDGDMYYVPIVDELWKTPLRSVSLDQQRMPMKETWLVVDSGTAIIRGPSELILSLLTSLEPFYHSIKDCSNVHSFPVLSFEVHDGLRLDIEPGFYMVMMDGQCIPAFASSGTDEWIVGEPFLYKYLTVFDMDKKRMGFGMSHYAADECATHPVPARPRFFQSISATSQHTIQRMSKTTSLRAIKVVTTLPTQPKAIVSQNGAASSAGGAAASGQATTVTKKAPIVTPAPTAAPTKKYACV